MMIEARDVKFNEITETESSRGRVAHIEGLVFHSGLAVREIKINTAGQAAVIEVSVMPASPERSGSFNVAVPLSGSIQQLLFGPSRTEIWRRKSEGDLTWFCRA